MSGMDGFAVPYLDSSGRLLSSQPSKHQPLAPSPYRFTVSAYCGDGNWWWVALNGSDVLWDEPFATEAEAREHAALVLAALHQATMEEP